MAQTSSAAPPPGQNMGAPLPRYEAVAKVTGGKLYAEDLPVPGRPAYAWFVKSSIAKGKIASIDDSEARAVPGVLLVMTHRNRAPLGPIKSFANGGTFVGDQNPLSGTTIHFAGQTVALVVADSFEAAREGAHRLKVRYAPTAAKVTFAESGRDESEPNPAAKPINFKNVDAALKSSAHVVEAEYSTPTQHHNPIELFSTTAYWEGPNLVLHEPTQFAWGHKEGSAGQLRINADNVRVKAPFVGGAFGSKAGITDSTALAALAARELGRPVKLVASRSNGFTHAGYRQETRSRVRLGCDASGRLTGYDHHFLEFTSRVTPYNNGGLDKCAAMYAFQAVKTDSRLVKGDRSPPSFMRAPAEVPTIYALEAAMNELAAKAGIDPIEFRKRNDTRVNVTNDAPYTSRSLVQCFDAAAQAFGWARRNPQPRSMRDGDWLVGWGCSMACYPTQLSPSTARVTLFRNGGALVEVAAHDVGTGCYTIVRQAAAERLGIDPGLVEVRCGDSRLPPGPVAGGSVTTASVTSAVCNACDEINSKLGVGQGAPVAQRAQAFNRLGVGQVEVVGNWIPAGMDQSALTALYDGQIRINGGPEDKRTMFAFGAELLEVRVNERTREIRVPRAVGAFAAGRIMNTRTAHSQLMGGMIWGIGSALHEVTEIDRARGRYFNDNIAEYLIPVNADIGQVEIIMVPEVDREINVLGVKGIGELANVGTPAAITDAVWHATGKRIRDLPVTLDKLF
ncbi:MAG: xanthine dehydrogenase family protein molybdopterin-binding subunit [Pseudomonadota bacterium]|nr:xanthine dehydrogenase family protein molybdopterin-binding subunit [Pseudomonadota bacterium]